MTGPTIAGGRPFMRRQPVARFFAVGRMTINDITRTIWGFMTFYNGPERMPTFARFAGTAPVDDFGQLRLDQLQEGDIVVDPGLVYKPIPSMDVTGKMMAEHTRAMKTFTVKDLLVAERDDGPAVDMGVINLSGKETIQ